MSIHSLPGQRDLQPNALSLPKRPGGRHRGFPLSLCAAPLVVALLSACGGNPPPQPPMCPPPGPPGEPVVFWRGDNQVDITWSDMPVTVCEGEDIQAQILQRQYVLQLPAPRVPESLDSFCGFDRGDAVEADVAFYDDQNRVLYRRSLHLEGGVPECYDAFEPRPSLSNEPTSSVTVVAGCRANGPNEVHQGIFARCHLQGTVIFQQGGPPPPSCVPPGEPPDPWGSPVPPETRAPMMGGALQAAKIVVGNRCGQNPAETLQLLAEALKDAGYCADGPWGKEAGKGDAIAIKAPDPWHGAPLFEEWHAVAFTDGCYTSGGKYVGAWPYLGTPGACGPPLPGPLHHAKVKLFQTEPKRTYDSAFLVGPDADYCAAVGYTDGRSFCTVRPDGHPERDACEELAVGTPQWSFDGTGRCFARPNPYQYRCDNDAHGTLTVCAEKASWACASIAVE